MAHLPVATWTATEIDEYLTILGLDHLQPTFRKHGMTDNVLWDLTDDDFMFISALSELRASRVAEKLPAPSAGIQTSIENAGKPPCKTSTSQGIVSKQESNANSMQCLPKWLQPDSAVPPVPSGKVLVPPGSSLMTHSSQSRESVPPMSVSLRTASPSSTSVSPKTLSAGFSQALIIPGMNKSNVHLTARHQCDQNMLALQIRESSPEDTQGSNHFRVLAADDRDTTSESPSKRLRLETYAQPNLRFTADSPSSQAFPSSAREASQTAVESPNREVIWPEKTAKIPNVHHQLPQPGASVTSLSSSVARRCSSPSGSLEHDLHDTVGLTSSPTKEMPAPRASVLSRSSSVAQRRSSPSRSPNQKFPKQLLHGLVYGRLDEDVFHGLILDLLFESLPRDNIRNIHVQTVADTHSQKRFTELVDQESDWCRVRIAWHLAADKKAAASIAAEGGGICCDEHRSSCGRYGRGGYVALSAAKANAYAATGGTRHLFLVLALPDQSVQQGQRNFRPQRTAADAPGHPTEYCFVDPARLHCVCLVTYEWLPTGRREKVVSAGARVSHIVPQKRTCRSMSPSR